MSAPPTHRPAPRYFTCEACHQLLRGGGQGHRCRMKQRQDTGNLLQPAAFCPDIKPWPMDSLDGISWDTIFCGPMTICDVPESQVPLYSGIMAELLSRVLENSRNAWKALLLLPRMVFVLPRGGKKFDHQVYLNLMMFKAGEWETLLSRKFRKMGESSPFPPSKEKRATALARAGYFSGAARVLTSGELCDTSNPEVYAKLKELHPEPDAPPAPLLKAAACPFTSKHLLTQSPPFVRDALQTRLAGVQSISAASPNPRRTSSSSWPNALQCRKTSSPTICVRSFLALASLLQKRRTMAFVQLRLAPFFARSSVPRLLSQSNPISRGTLHLVSLEQELPVAQSRLCKDFASSKPSATNTRLWALIFPMLSTLSIETRSQKRSHSTSLCSKHGSCCVMGNLHSSLFTDNPRFLQLAESNKATPSGLFSSVWLCNPFSRRFPAASAV